MDVTRKTAKRGSEIAVGRAGFRVLRITGAKGTRAKAGPEK